MIALDAPPAYPGRDPSLRLASTGRRILEAARRLLARHGYSGLTIDAIAKEAGESKSSVHYHFGGKAGLMTALADSVMYDDYVEEIQHTVVDGAEPADEVTTLVRTSRTSTADRASYQTFFEMLPYMARDKALQERMTAVYRWYREFDAWTLAATDDPDVRAGLEPLSALTVAVADGLAIQYLADPDFDSDRAFDCWESILRLALDRLRTAEGLDTE